MGYLTVVILHNDAEHAFNDHPEEFGRAILDGIAKAQRKNKQVSVPFQSYANYIDVEPPRHADHQALFLSKGNCVTVIGEYEQAWKELALRHPDLAQDDVKSAAHLLKGAKAVIKEPK